MQIFMLHPNTRWPHSRWQELAPGGFNTRGGAQSHQGFLSALGRSGANKKSYGMG